jgi:hypothetical protein
MSDEPRWVIWRKNLETREREVYLETYATEAQAAARADELDDEKPGYLHWSAREDEWEVGALDRMRARIDADPTHRRRVEELKQELRDAMTGEDELTDERLEHLRYALNQYEIREEHQLSLDELRPPMSGRAVERLRWCAGLLRWSEQWDFSAEFGGQLDMLPTMNLAASREAQEALLDEIERLRAALGHLWYLDERHGLLDGLYEWRYDQLGYRSTRTCQSCDVESNKHARLDARHLPDCHLRAVEEALGVQQYGLKTTSPPADVLGDDDE